MSVITPRSRFLSTSVPYLFYSTSMGLDVEVFGAFRKRTAEILIRRRFPIAVVDIPC